MTNIHAKGEGLKTLGSLRHTGYIAKINSFKEINATETDSRSVWSDYFIVFDDGANIQERAIHTVKHASIFTKLSVFIVTGGLTGTVVEL